MRDFVSEFVLGARAPAQRCVAWVPPDALDDEGDARAQTDGRLIASAGWHGGARGVLDRRPVQARGGRGLTFRAGALSMDWPRTAGAASVTGSAEGTVRLHDFFAKRSVHARRDTADTSNSKAVAWGVQGVQADQGDG